MSLRHELEQRLTEPFLNNHMRYREIILFEAAGTYGFFRPVDQKEILCDGHYNKEHADYVLDNPAAFGLSPAEVKMAIDTIPTSPDQYASSKMQEMTRILALVIRKGWVRVNYYRGAWSFQAIDLRTVRKAVIFYASNHGMQEANIDWGPDIAHPEGASLYPEDQIEHFIKTGRIK
jgi:hypothetical protein